MWQCSHTTHTASTFHTAHQQAQCVRITQTHNAYNSVYASLCSITHPWEPPSPKPSLLRTSPTLLHSLHVFVAHPVIHPAQVYVCVAECCDANEMMHDENKLVVLSARTLICAQQCECSVLLRTYTCCDQCTCHVLALVTHEAVCTCMQASVCACSLTSFSRGLSTPRMPFEPL